MPPALRSVISDDGHFEVQAKACATCIYSKTSTLNVRELEAAIADTRLPRFFTGYRVCHHSKTACCRGFWNRHKHHFTLGQIAQRLGFVRFVAHDTLGPTRGKAKR